MPRTLPIKPYRFWMFSGLLAAAAFAIALFTSNALRAIPLGILQIREETIIDLQSGRTLARGHAAAWAPTHDSLLFASLGEQQQLVMRRWVLGLPVDRPLPLPQVSTKYRLAWQWSFSPDGRWLAVRRELSRRHIHELHQKPEIFAHAKEVAWHGVVDLQQWQARPWPVSGEIVGWQGNNCLVQERQYGPLQLVDPVSPSTVEILDQNSGVIQALSPDGRHAVVFDGAEGNTHATLRHWGHIALTLDKDSLQRTRHYARGTGVDATFSADGAWLGTSITRWSEGGWTTTVAIDSLDGSRRLYEDQFELRSVNDAPRPSFPLHGPNHLAYFRFRRESNEGELVFVRLHGDHASTVLTQQIARPNYRRAQTGPIWSPTGEAFVWLSPDRMVISADPTTGTCKPLLELPDQYARWNWAPPRVAGNPN